VFEELQGSEAALAAATTVEEIEAVQWSGADSE
jgi:hypothetical protein